MSFLIGYDERVFLFKTVFLITIFLLSADSQLQTLQAGDAIIAVNGRQMDNLLHDQVVAELRNCGPLVQLTVRPFEEAHQVLQLAGQGEMT